MASFRDMLAECESLISMEEGLNLVEMLPPDELGCRVAQSALRSVCEVFAARTGDVTTWMRVNISGSQSLSSNAEITQVTRPEFPRLFYFDKLSNQNPDGLFSIEIKRASGASTLKTVISYEADGMAKSEPKEYRNLLRKMSQAVDLHRCWQSNSSSAVSTSAYTIRSNLKNGVGAYSNTDLKDNVNFLHWIYNFYRSHMSCILRILHHMTGRNGHEMVIDISDQKAEPTTFDYHFFIGPFTLINREIIKMKGEDDFDWPKCSDQEFSKQMIQDNQTTIKNYNSGNVTNAPKFVHRGHIVSNNQRYSFNIDLPNAFLTFQETQFQYCPMFDKDFANQWEAKTKVLTFPREDFLQCLALQRCQFIFPHKKSHGKRALGTAHGFWTMMDCRKFVDLNLSRKKQIIKSCDAWHADIIQLPKAIKSDPIKDFWDDAQNYKYLVLVNNFMLQMECAMWTIFGGFEFWPQSITDDTSQLDDKDLFPFGLKWKNKYMCAASSRNEITLSDGSTRLNTIKQSLRKHPEYFRNRSHMTFDSSQHFKKKNGSLRSCLYHSLHETLPSLEGDVRAYINRFNIPYAALFLRMIRCHSIVALRELARQVQTGKMNAHYTQMLETMPLCTQSELNYVFEQLRRDLDVLIDRREFTQKPNFVASPQKLNLYDVVREALLTIGQEEPDAGDIVNIMQELIQDARDIDRMHDDLDDESLEYQRLTRAFHHSIGGRGIV